MKISIIKERLEGEKRVILTPEQIGELVVKGFEVFVENGAGDECGFDDIQYKKEGAVCCSTDETWNVSDYIFKYKAPMESEYKYFRKGLTICALFHAEGNENLVKEMERKEVSAFTYEFLRTDDGIFPLALPGGEIAGKSAVIHGAYLLQSQFGGKGKILVGIHGAKKTTVGVIGYGNVGSAAIKLASDMGAKVIVFGRNIEKMRKVSLSFDADIQFLESTIKNYEKYLPQIDLLIGAILISTYDTPPLLTEELIGLMQKGSVVVDVTCGYGSGYMPTIKHTTTLNHPSYIDNGIVYCKIDNLPSAFPLTTVEAYSKNAFPYIAKMIQEFKDGKLTSITKSCQILDRGKIVHEIIRQHMRFYDKNRI
jgi:alanine dehydrogenase